MDAAASIDGLRFGYALYQLPPGRLPFRRWRWELWHGPRLVAAGWRTARAEAGRALRRHAAEFAHRLFGLPAPARQPSGADLLPGTTELVEVGAIRLRLVPQGLEEQPR